MADVKISALPPIVAPLTTGALFAVVDGGVTYKATVTEVVNAFPIASGSVTGLLSSADWATFNAKEPALTKGNLTEATSSILTIVGGTNAVIGAGTTIQVAQATSFTSGYLSSADWSTFNNKQSALSFGNLSEVTSSVLTITGGTGAVIGGGTTVQVKQAGAGQSGFLSSGDWTTFNNKQNAITLTTLGTSGAATFAAGTLNIPIYSTSLINWTEAFSGGTQATSSFTATNAAANVNAALVPKGTGAIVAAVPDGGVGGGNLRGNYAVDLQIQRAAASQVASGANAFLGTGVNCTVSNSEAVIISGRDSSNSGQRCFIGTGYALTISGVGYSSIVGGHTSSITVNGNYSVLGGGQANSISQTHSVVVGGQSNTSSIAHSFVGGGQGNTASTNSHSAVVGGQTNTASGQHSFVGGGQGNGASGQWSVVSGGQNNSAGYLNAVGGGTGNTCSSSIGGIFCGQGNSSSDNWSVVVGGLSNSATASRAFVGGGGANSVSAIAGTIAGGLSNSVIADNGSVSGGANARAYLYGQRSNAAGQFAALSDAQTSAITLRRSVTGITAPTAQELFLDGSSLRAILALPTGATNARVWNARIDLTAIVTTVGAGTVTLNHVFSGNYMCTIRRTSVAGSTALIGPGVIVASQVWDTTMQSSVVTIDADTANEALRIQFTPPTTAAADTIIRVVATVYLTEVGR